MNEKAIDQADEEVLACEVSDDALEAAAEAEGRPHIRPRCSAAPLVIRASAADMI
jgi:hypothetical protein